MSAWVQYRLSAHSGSRGWSLLKPGRILRLVQWFRFPLVRTLRRSPAALFISVMTIAIAIKAFLPPMIEAARSLLRLLESTRRPGFIILAYSGHFHSFSGPVSVRLGMGLALVERPEIQPSLPGGKR
jgi:hypothetical protein